MTPPNPMIVPLRELPTTRDVELSARFVSDTLAGMAMRTALERPDDDPQAGHAQVHVEFYGDDSDNVFARGQLQGWFELACSRCVEPVKVQLAETLAVTFVPRSRLPKDEEFSTELSEEELELDEEDLDLYGYEGEALQLEQLLRDKLILAVPFAPLCRDACQGLCPQCGIDRNRETCNCEPPIDPRLAGLRDIQLPSI